MHRIQCIEYTSLNIMYRTQQIENKEYNSGYKYIEYIAKNKMHITQEQNIIHLIENTALTTKHIIQCIKYNAQKTIYRIQLMECNTQNIMHINQYIENIAWNTVNRIQCIYYSAQNTLHEIQGKD